METQPNFTLRIDVNLTYKQEEALTPLLNRLLHGQKGLKAMAVSIQEALDQAAQVAAEERAEVLSAIAGLKAEIQALRDQIDNGTPVSDEQLVSLLGSVESILTPEDTTAP